MERRNTEKQEHVFSDAFMAENNIYDLQGLLMGDMYHFPLRLKPFL